MRYVKKVRLTVRRHVEDHMHLVCHIPRHNCNTIGSHERYVDTKTSIFLSSFERFLTHPPATGGYPPLGTALPGLLLNMSACGPGPVL